MRVTKILKTSIHPLRGPHGLGEFGVIAFATDGASSTNATAVPDDFATAASISTVNGGEIRFEVEIGIHVVFMVLCNNSSIS